MQCDVRMGQMRSMTKAPPTNLNLENPLAEKERHDRLHACMLARGFTHAAYAKALGVHWTSLKRWLSGEQDIGLEPLIKMSKLTGYTLDQLVFGLEAQTPAPVVRAGMSMNKDELRAYLDRQLIPNPVRLGLTTALKREEFELLAITEDLVADFCAEYSIKLGEGPGVALESSLARVLRSNGHNGHTNGKSRKRK